MSSDYYKHPERSPQDAPGPFYSKKGWCIACEFPRACAPKLIAEIEGNTLERHFSRQPKSRNEVRQACDAIRASCVNALRYGGKDKSIIRRLNNDPDFCDYLIVEKGRLILANTVNEQTNGTSSSSLPLERQLPPEMHAAIGELKAGPGEEIAWWQPTWQDGLRHLGWRWIFFLPAIGVIGFAVATYWFPPLANLIVPLGFKFMLFAAGVAITLIGYALRQATKARTEPFCIHCGYNLTGLPDNYRCPECGRSYSWRVINEYRRDPQWFVTRWKASHKLPEDFPTLDAGPGPQRKSRDGT